MLVAGLTIKKCGEEKNQVLPLVLGASGNLCEDLDELKKKNSSQVRLDFSLYTLVCLPLKLQFAGNYSVN